MSLDWVSAAFRAYAEAHDVARRAVEGGALDELLVRWRDAWVDTDEERAIEREMSDALVEIAGANFARVEIKSKGRLGTLWLPLRERLDALVENGA